MMPDDDGTIRPPPTDRTRTRRAPELPSPDQIRLPNQIQTHPVLTLLYQLKAKSGRSATAERHVRNKISRKAFRFHFMELYTADEC